MTPYVQLRTSNRRSSVTVLHEELGVPWLDDTWKTSVCIELYKLLDRKFPPSLVNVFAYRKPVPALRSGATKRLVKPSTRTKIADNDFVLRPITYRESLLCHVKEANSMDMFEEHLKRNLYFEHSS